MEAGQVVPLAIHVDYWDYLGWKDTFGSKDHTARQAEYVKRIKGDKYFAKGSKYTPNLVIDGAASCVGTDKKAAAKAIAAALGETANIALDLAATLKDGKIKATVGAKNVTAMDYPASLVIVVAVVEDDVVVDITSGELTGKKFTYSNAVRRWAKPIDYACEKDKRKTFEAEIAVEKEWKTLRVVAFVQDRETMKVWQAAVVAVK